MVAGVLAVDVGGAALVILTPIDATAFMVELVLVAALAAATTLVGLSGGRGDQRGPPRRTGRPTVQVIYPSGSNRTLTGDRRPRLGP